MARPGESYTLERQRVARSHLKKVRRLVKWENFDLMGEI